MNGHRLDVVIPAHKAQFLGETLESLALQDDRAFRVWVGDDASPDDLAGVCARFSDRLDLVHHRFADNLGATDLVGQWTRCVALGDSPWVWLFSDDDVASPGCVGALRRALADGAAVARLDLAIVGSAGEVLDIPPAPPERESREQFLWQRLKRRRESFVVEYAFRRDRWQAAGGFVSLPAAWCSDDATWWRLAGSDGIRHASGGHVGWRWSGANISSSHRRDAEKREGCLRFLELVGAGGLAEMESILGLAPGAGADAAMDWLRFHLGGLRAPVGGREAMSIEERMERVAGSSAAGLAGMLRKRNWKLWADRLRGRLR